MTNILIVLSAADYWTLANGDKHPSGYWAEEFVVPYRKFLAAGYSVDIATPGGVAPTPDPTSFDPAVAGSEALGYADYLDSLDALRAPFKLSEVDADGYDAIVIPGGHGPMEDLVDDPDMGDVLATAVSHGRLVVAICHGPAALLSVTDPNGAWPFAGKQMTSLTDEEETLFGTATNARWLLETRLRQQGASFVSGQPWASKVVVDGRLITGQNPASSAELADHVLEALA
ncbi:type 1 glutamine amidotransferase domain-containing protein [Actinoplanes sp. NPDC089786]|uniref:type 1 glutamine amidotransferase domain-containing protein n=1 Tax=Actinoplanes sp. NPDC089786 TaxID=3155185 RepID=UPI003426ED17